MSDDRRQAAVDHVSRLLERDLITVDEYNPLVERILATSTDVELADILDRLPAPIVDDDDVLVIECNGGVVKETPHRLPATIEVRCVSGVMKVDLSLADIDGDVDLEIDNGKGVLQVIVPRGVDTEIVSNRASGGVFKNALRRQPTDAGAPCIRIHVTNDTGVIKLRHPSRWRRRG